MKHFPIFIAVEQRKVLVVGNGEAAAQKLRLVAKSEAEIAVVSPAPSEELQRMAEESAATLHRRSFRVSDLEGTVLAFIEPADGIDAEGIAHAARASGVPVNVVDRPELCTFLTPAIVDRDPVVVAIGTEGAAPVLAQGIKSRIEAMLPPGLGRLATVAKSLRPRVAKELPPGRSRRTFWQSLFFGPIAHAFLGGNHREFEARVDAEEAYLQGGCNSFGRVALVGAGPGDPELLTLKAQRLLQSADVIVHDRLVGPDILEYARRDAQRICVGKTPGAVSPSQSEINRILISHALEGRFVVRLKGGDPYVFGRGAEEQEALAAVGIQVDVVPGITAAAGCAASIRLPLTRRGENRGFTLLTAMAEDGPADHDWAYLSKDGTAFAIYMVVGSATRTRAKLLDAGICEVTPVVVVENGTLASERAFETTVAELCATIDAEGVRGPAIIYVGLSKSARPAPRDGQAPRQRKVPELQS